MVITDVKAHGENGKMVTISKQAEDITGDGKKEKIFITGARDHMKKALNKKNVITISASNHKSYKIALANGRKPSLQLVDLNHDGVKDVFASVTDAVSGKNRYFYVYTLRDFVLTDLTLPDPLVLDSGFLNGYKAKIKIKNTGKVYLFDLKERKKYYEKLGIFYKGKLNEPTELMVHSNSNLKPVMLEGDEMGLKVTQKIEGAAYSDTVGFVESSWYYSNSKWNLVDVVVLKLVHSKI